MWIGTGIFLALIWGMGFGDGMANYENRIRVVKKASDINYEK